MLNVPNISFQISFKVLKNSNSNVNSIWPEKGLYEPIVRLQWNLLKNLQPSTKIVRQTPPSPLANDVWLLSEAGILFWIDLPFPTLKKGEGGS